MPPTRIPTPVLSVDAEKIHQVDTRKAETLHGMWMVFSKCAEFMEEGRRLENLSWRLWNRETFCVPPQERRRRNHSPRVRQDTKEVPELSSSVDSAASDEADRIESHIQCPPRSLECRPTIVGEDSILSISRGREKHVTSMDLEKMVSNIKEKRYLEPLEAVHSHASDQPAVDITPRPSSPTPTRKSQAPKSEEQQQPHQPHREQQQQQHQHQHQHPHQHQQTEPSPQQKHQLQQQDNPQPPPVRQHQSSESCSTAPLDGNESERPTAAASDTSVSSAGMVKSTSVVRGFSPSHISSSYRSQPRLSSTAENTKATLPTTSSPLKQKKKGGMFTLGSSSGDEGSSFDDRANMVRPQRSSLTDGLNRVSQPSLRPPPPPPPQAAAPPPPQAKGTPFKPADAQPVRPVRESAEDVEDAIETDDEDDDEEVVSESAIEDDDSSSEWEDSPTDAGETNADDQQKQFDQGEMFQRVDSRPNLVSRPSLLTMMMHQPAQQRNGAPHSGLPGGTWSCSTPALQRQQMASTAANGHPAKSSSHDKQEEEEDDDDDENTLTMKGPEVPRSRPIVSKPIPCRSVAHSPRTTRRNMLATELTDSLRRHILTERRQRMTSVTSKPFKRRHTAHDMANLQDYPAPPTANDEQQPPTTPNRVNAGQVSKHNQTSKNNSWNHYFDCGPWEYHEKGW